ncbi:caspase family protein [Nostoc sp.]|uniref:caspase family protein n=1 Tax=Nostoc sp. TaxID=1180 RepID=UPI002FFB6819
MGRNWAIVVGINHYENLRSLNFAKRDASAIATWFQQEAKFNQVFLFTDDSPAIAANSPIPTQPTFGHVRRFLRAQFENIQSPLLKPEDNLWFFFAGHGNRYKDKDYLMFSDSDPGDVEHTAISVDFITQRLRRSGADNVVLFLDACREESSRAGLGIGEQRYQGVITFYSCTANQKSWEIEELQHGSFTHCLLEGLRLQGEANCATVERLAQYLDYQVPHLNTRYGKPTQNPYLQAEPPYKMYFILLEQTATLRDVEPLKYQASQAENRDDLSLAKQLWVRVLAVSRGDWDAIEAIERLAIRQRLTISTPEPVTSSNGGRSVSSEPVSGSSTLNESAQELLLAQRQEEHRQNLVRYQQAFSEAITQEYPLNELTNRQLKQLQQSLQLNSEEVLQIEQPILGNVIELNQIQEKLYSQNNLFENDLNVISSEEIPSPLLSENSPNQEISSKVAQSYEDNTTIFWSIPSLLHMIGGLYMEWITSPSWFWYLLLTMVGFGVYSLSYISIIQDEDFFKDKKDFCFLEKVMGLLWGIGSVISLILGLVWIIEGALLGTKVFASYFVLPVILIGEILLIAFASVSVGVTAAGVKKLVGIFMFPIMIGISFLGLGIGWGIGHFF